MTAAETSAAETSAAQTPQAPRAGLWRHFDFLKLWRRPRPFWTYA